MRSVIPEVLTLISNADQKFQPTAETAKVWDSLLAPFTDAQLRDAAIAVASRKNYGTPTVGDLIEQIDGRVETVRVPVTDHWNRTILRSDDTPAYTLEQRRVFPDGRSEPLALPEHKPNSDRRDGPGSLEDGIDKLLGELPP